MCQYDIMEDFFGNLVYSVITFKDNEQYITKAFFHHEDHLNCIETHITKKWFKSFINHYKMKNKYIHNHK